MIETMPPIKWETLVSDATGVIEYKRVRELIAATAAILGILLALAATVWEIKGGKPFADRTLLGWIVTALIAPVTGGTIASSITTSILKKVENGSTTPQ